MSETEAPQPDTPETEGDMETEEDETTEDGDEDAAEPE